MPYNECIFVIAVETGNWIVLDNEEQLEFFNLLIDYKLSDALSRFCGSIENAQKVVIQLEARDFENTQVMLKSPDTIMHVYLTNLCNLRCPHCYMYSGSKLSNELTTQEVLDLLTKFSEHGGSYVTFSGGEICTRTDLYEVVKHAHSLGLKSELLTNGTLWTEELIEKVAPFTSRVQISIDGYSETSNAPIRGKDNFNRALDTLDKFLQKGVHADVGITPFFDESLQTDWMKYAQFGKELHEKYDNYPFSVKFNGEMLDGRDVKLNKDQKKEYREIIRKIETVCFGENFDDSFVAFHKMRGIEDNCTFGNLSVNADGDVFFCSVLPMNKATANLRNNDFEHIMQLSQLAKNLSNVNNLEPCKDCELKYICGGDCRIIYFEDFVNYKVDEIEHHPKRMCDDNTKQRFYELMIRTNHLLFQ